MFYMLVGRNAVSVDLPGWMMIAARLLSLPHAIEERFVSGYNEDGRESGKASHSPVPATNTRSISDIPDCVKADNCKF